MDIAKKNPFASYFGKLAPKDNYYSLVNDQYSLLSNYVHGSEFCNPQDIYSIFNDLYRGYDELINNLNIK